MPIEPLDEDRAKSKSKPDSEAATQSPAVGIQNLRSPELAPYWLSAIVESADDAIISKTLEGIITSWNTGAERIFGYTPPEIVGKSVTLLIPDDHINEEAEILARIRIGERVEHYETLRQRKDGSLVEISLTVSPIKSADGKIIGASKVARDISKQRQAQRLLDESSDRLTLALAASNLGDWSWDLATDIVTFSEAAARIFEVPPGPKLTWAKMRDLLHVDDRERARLALDESLANKSDYDIEYRLNSSNGLQRWVSAKGRAQYREDGSLSGMLGVVQDITARKLTEAALLEQTEALSTLNRLGQLISAELDLHKAVQAVTEAATELTGARFGCFFYNVLNEDGTSDMLFTLAGVPHEASAHFSMQRTAELFGATFRHGPVRIADVKLDPRYGKNAPFYGVPEGYLPLTSYLAVPVVSSSGDVLGGLYFGHPEAGVFTERAQLLVVGLAAQASIAMDNASLFQAAKRARLEAERAAAQNELLYRKAEDSSRLKDEFLATISHELRTPLTSILGWSRMLRSHQLSDEDYAKALETIERNAHSQAQLIDDLLDVSRIITGKLRMDVRPANPYDFIEAAIEALTPAAIAKGVRVQKIMDTGVAAIPGDPVRLQQVVWNLLSNAIKFTPRGERVQVCLQRVNSHIEIVISDTGQGISGDFLPYVFDRFRQADQRASRQHGGMGLGLSIVRHLVELHGGSVHAASGGEGQGATFTVRLPVAAVYEVDQSVGRVHPAASDPLPETECGERLDGLKILIVDDEPDTRDMLKAGLSRCGAEVVTAASAGEAFAALEADLPSLIISDIGMPGEDGYEMIRRLRGMPGKAGGKIPAIALTAYARVEDRMNALRAGYQMHVPKPVDLAELVAVAASLVKRG